MYHVYWVHDQDLHVTKRDTLKEAEWDLMVHKELYGNKAWISKEVDVTTTATRSSQPTMTFSEVVGV
jgi:hypothetical protein